MNKLEQALEQALDNTIKKKKPQQQQRKYAVYLTADEIDAVIEMIGKEQHSELLKRVLEELKNA